MPNSKTAIKIIMVGLSSLLAAGCSEEPCSETILEEKSRLIAQKLPLLAVKDKAELAKFGSKAMDFASQEKDLTLAQQCEVVDELLQQVNEALE